MDVVLTPELEQFVTERVVSGRYPSTDEVIREGLRLLQEREQGEQSRLDALRGALDEGIASIERGEGIDGADGFARLRARRS